MLKSYLKTAFRFLLKNKTYSFINIIGLAIGTLSCIYILLYVQDQYSYDKHHNDATDIYRITTQLAFRGDKHNAASSSPPIAPAMKHDFAEVLDYTRVVPTLGETKRLLTYKDKSFYEDKTFYVDSSFFKLFTYHFVSGNALDATVAPYSVVLLKPVADKLFGSEEPLNKTITIEDAFGKHSYKVTGVIDETLGKSHIQPNLLISMNSGGTGEFILSNNSWAGNNFINAYVKLRPGASAAALEKKLPAFLNKYGAQQMKALGMEKRLHLQPVTSIHTTPNYEWERSPTVSPSFLYTLLLIALLIQVMACINFMNLSTARAAKRAKEVGVRKVAGAGRFDLIGQFMGESFMLALFGVAIALPMLWLALPYLNNITHADIHLQITDYRIWLLLGGMVVITGLLAGSYPAFYLSAFKVIKVIKGNFSNQASAAVLRRSLVVFQFVVSVVLIAGIIVIYSQLNYIKHKDLGFNPSQKLVLSMYTNDAPRKLTALKQDLQQMAEIKAVSKANSSLGVSINFDHGVYLAGGDMAHSVDAQNITTDEHFLKASGIRLLSGHNFSVTDSGKVLINETLARRLGLDIQSAPGTRLYTHYEPDPITYVDVAGVMKDFNYNSLQGEIKPFMLVYNPKQSDLNTLIVAANSSNYQQLLQKIETLWHKDIPNAPFDYTFLDEQVQQQYQAEITLSHIINSFTLIAVFISCLGLFGLAAFSAEQRIKEIGVRKVLGASEASIVKLLSADFLKLVGMSILIAVPIAWWSMNHWLQAFVYRITISWWMFALAGLMAIGIALFTVAFQAVKAAWVNPIKSLRSE